MKLAAVCGDTCLPVTGGVWTEFGILERFSELAIAWFS